MRWWPRAAREPAATPAEARDERLSAYLDGDVSPDEAAALEDSLASDPSMQEALSGMRRVTDTLAQLDEVRAPRSFAIEAPAAPEARPAGSPRRASRLEFATRIGSALAAVALTIAFVGDGLTTADRAADGTAAPPVAMQALQAPETQQAAQAAPEAAGSTADSDTESTAESKAAPATTLAAPAPALAPAGRAAAPQAPQTADAQAAPAAARRRPIRSGWRPCRGRRAGSNTRRRPRRGPGCSDSTEGSRSGRGRGCRR
jgi:hypothetical protein